MGNSEIIVSCESFHADRRKNKTITKDKKKTKKNPKTTSKQKQGDSTTALLNSTPRNAVPLNSGLL